jgi:multicomponent Na+:H+ antiporter subunit G
MTSVVEAAGPVEILAAALILLGALLCVVAAIGVLRLRDVLLRMHATSKAGALGAGLVFVALALIDPEAGGAAKALGAAAFVLLTAPIAAHAVGRAAWRAREPLAKDTWIDPAARPDDG